MWIGHGIITGDARTQGMISDSEQRSLDELLTQGPALGRILRDASGASPGDNAIVLLVRPATGELLRARVWTTTLNMRRDSRPLLWLGTVSDAESVAHLRALYDHLRTGEEFSPVTVHLDSVPDNEQGRRFLLQFFGQFLGVGATHTVARKKARIMAHWGGKLGVSIVMDDHLT